MLTTASLDITTETVFACPLCNERGRKTIYKDLEDHLFNVPGKWTFNQCVCCGLVYLDPRPTIKDIGKTYTISYANRKPVGLPSALTWHDKLIRGVRLGYLANSYGYKEKVSPFQRILALPISVLPHLWERLAYSVMKLQYIPGGRLLDVGCGNGSFLEFMSNLGWKAEGLDTDPKVVEMCKRRGLNVKEGILENQNYCNNFYDAITLKHVIEHVFDPVNLLKVCNNILKPGGKLVILTPNMESLGHKKFKHLWIGLDAPRHLFLFTSKTLSEAIQKAGLKVINLSSTGRISEFNWLVSHELKKHNNNAYISKTKLMSRVMAKIYDLKVRALLMVDKKIGEELILVATKLK